MLQWSGCFIWLFLGISFNVTGSSLLKKAKPLIKFLSYPAVSHKMDTGIKQEPALTLYSSKRVMLHFAEQDRIGQSILISGYVAHE